MKGVLFALLCLRRKNKALYDFLCLVLLFLFSDLFIFVYFYSSYAEQPYFVYSRVRELNNNNKNNNNLA